MPAEYRRLLYMRREEVPAYPEDADSLLQVRNWLATRVIEGELYDLEFGSGLSDMVGQPVCCLSNIRPGWNYSTHYVRRSAPRDSERSYLRPFTMLGGPSYSWRSDSTLRERSYLTPDRWQTWYYDSTRVLIHYEFMLRESVRRIGQTVSVWFSREGALIACEVDGDAYWMGRRGLRGEMWHYLTKYYRWPQY